MTKQREETVGLETFLLALATEATRHSKFPHKINRATPSLSFTVESNSITLKTVAVGAADNHSRAGGSFVKTESDDLGPHR